MRAAHRTSLTPAELYAYSQTADVAHKRLSRTIDVPAGGGKLSFWVSADTESHWDHVAVEAHTVGQDDWTTLSDVSGNELTSHDTGDSCVSGWNSLHPHLDHYQTRNADGTCSPTGTTGAWHAFSGNSSGWNEWIVDLVAYSGKQVEVSISYINDWAIQNLGVFVDDATAPGEPTHDFKSGLGAWSVPGAPEGPAANANGQRQGCPRRDPRPCSGGPAGRLSQPTPTQRAGLQVPPSRCTRR